MLGIGVELVCLLFMFACQREGEGCGGKVKREAGLVHPLPKPHRSLCSVLALFSLFYLSLTSPGPPYSLAHCPSSPLLRSPHLSLSIFSPCNSMSLELKLYTFILTLTILQFTPYHLSNHSIPSPPLSLCSFSATPLWTDMSLLPVLSFSFPA